MQHSPVFMLSFSSADIKLKTFLKLNLSEMLNFTLVVVYLLTHNLQVYSLGVHLGL